MLLSAQLQVYPEVTKGTLKGSVRYSAKYIFLMKHVIFIALAGLISCNNHRSSHDRVLKDFDSVSRSLDRTNEKISKSTNILYAELEKKFTTHDSLGKINNLQHAVQDFYGFISDLKKKFIITCGDSSGITILLQSKDDLSLTNSFFFQNKSNTKYLFLQLKSTQFTLRANVADSSLKDEINNWNTFKFSEGPGGSEENKFMKRYFYSIPPVAVITILNKFEMDITKFENQVLANYLKQ